MEIENKKKKTAVLRAGMTVFGASACVMALELAAGRIAAREFGSSIYTWTTVIGVTLAGITFGNYIGGRIADRFELKKAAGFLFAACSAACVLAVMLRNLTDDWEFLWRFGPALKILIYTTMLFFIPSALIGAISPVAVKMAIEPEHKGRVVGRMYALGAAGSILGTFLAGYWLIGVIGTSNTVWTIAAAMIVGAWIYLPRTAGSSAYLILIAFLITSATVKARWAKNIGSTLSLRQIPDPAILYEKESQYCYIGVRQVSKVPDERHFIEDNIENHSRLVMDKIRDLRLFYTQAFGEITQRAAKGKEKLCTLSIGGGGYVFPRYILEYWPASRVDVVEIDPEVTKAAQIGFGLSQETPIKTIALDGRNYIDSLLYQKHRGEETPRYDVVYMDAFNDMSVPFQLVTRQFNEKVFEITADDGIYVINLIDLYESGKFLASIVNTIKLTFPYIYVMPKPSHEESPGNFIIAAGKCPLDLENLENPHFTHPFKAPLLEDRDISGLNEKGGWTILDDDFSPVENLLAPVVRRRSQRDAAIRFMRQADSFYASGQWQKAVDRYRKTVRVCPSMAAESYNMMSKVLSEKGRFAEAAEALGSALEQTTAKIDRKTEANIHYRLGEALKILGHSQAATKHFESAATLLKAEITERGDSAEIFWQVGQVESAKGDLKEAGKFFEKALTGDPDKIVYHFSLINALAGQKKFEEAISRLDQSIRFMQGAKRTIDAEELKMLRRHIETESRK